MVQLSMQTVIFSHAISSAICMIVMISLWHQNRRNFTGLDLWLTNSVMQFAAIVLIGLRDRIPDFATIVLGNTLILSGIFLLYIGLERFIGKRSSQVHNYILLATFVLVHSYFTFVQPSLLARNINISLGIFLISCQAAWLMLRGIDDGMQPITRNIGFIAISICFINITRIILDLVMLTGNDFLNSNPYDTLIFLSSQMLFVILTFGLVLTVNRRLVKNLEKDILERKQAEKALREREPLYHQMFTDHTAVMLLIEPDSGRIVEGNPAAATFYGYSVDALQQMTIEQINTFTPEKVAKDREAAASGDQNYFVFSHRLASGEIRDVEIHSVPIQIEGRTLLYSIIHDITERKQAEDALLESEERFYKAFHASPVVMSISSLDDGEFLDANAQFFKLTDLKREEVIGHKATELKIWSDEQRQEILIEMKEYGFVHNKEVELLTQSGKVIPLLWFGDVVQINGKPCLIASGYDLTDRKRVENELIRQKSFFEQTFIQSATSTQILDQDGWCLRINPKLSELFGVKPEHMEGHAYNIFDDEEIKRKGIDTILKRVYEEQKVEKWEVNFDIGIAADSQDIEVEQKKKVWYANKAYPIVDSTGTLTNVIIQHDDISERKRAEHAVQDALHDKEVLLRELYHRTKNNMQVISSMLNLELSQTENESTHEILMDMDYRIRSMALVHQKLYQSQNLSSLDLKDYIADLVSLMLDSYQITPGRIGFELQAESVPVLIDTAIPCGLIINEILSNALKYAFPGDKKGNIQIHLEREKDATIVLEISDNGIGVPSERDLSQSNTLGMQTIFGIAKHQLNAKVDLETKNGLSWRIQFADNQYTSRV